MAEQNRLIIDVGNSAIKWAFCFDGHQPEVQSSVYPENTNSQYFLELWKGFNKPVEVFVSCVASNKIFHTLVLACEALWDVKVNRVRSLDKGFGINNAYITAADLGSDRWCAMIAVHQEIETPFIVVDCGSAITVDVVIKKGKHVGGYILPGLGMMKRSLVTQTADVKIDLKHKLLPLIPGNSTLSCVASGTYLAAVSLIETVFELQSKQVNNLQCVLTGGDASVVAELLSIKYILIPDLVIHGLAYISTQSIEK